MIPLRKDAENTMLDSSEKSKLMLNASPKRLLKLVAKVHCLAECPGSGDGERKTKPTRQMISEPLPASVLFGDWVLCSQSLPADQVCVLVVSAHGKKVVMYRERGVWVEGLTTAHWEPTHWTPLPPSPNVKDQPTSGA
jgi:hypothetical protein